MTDLIIKPDSEDPSLWVLCSDLVWLGRYDHFKVPAGFKTDFASVPRILWFFWPPYGRHTKAAVVHDYCYAKRPKVRVRSSRGQFQWRKITRWESDGVFRRIMKECGTPAWQRWTMWAGVRLGGWWGWLKWRLED